MTDNITVPRFGLAPRTPTRYQFQNPDFYLTPGLTLLCARTGSGKSTAALALCHMAVCARLRALYISLDEADSTVETPLTPPISGTVDPKYRADRDDATRPLRTYLDGITLIPDASAMDIIVIDSLVGYMSFAAGAIQAPAMKGGMVPGYAAGLLMLHRFALTAFSRPMAIVGTLNTDTFNLEGLDAQTHGTVDLNGKAGFTKVDRTHRGDPVSVSWPSDSITYARDILTPAHNTPRSPNRTAVQNLFAR